MGLTAASATDMDRQWPAVGRLNVTGGGFCTATLIGELHVLTAAHCVFDAQSGARVDVDDLEFRAGWQDGQAESYRKIAAVRVHPDFSFAEQEGLKRVASDLAILRLRTPIAHPDIIPFSVAQMPMRGARVAVVSYAHNRDYVCWYGDMTFADHLFKLLSITSTRASLTIGEYIEPRSYPEDLDNFVLMAHDRVAENFFPFTS